MAGAGYKLFNTGDVLLASEVNTYLMQQTVMVFDDAAARTTALSGVVAEGMLSYLKDTNAVEVYDGANWVASDDPNAIQNTIVAAKGDIIGASANDVPAVTSVGADGTTLVADSAATTGLRWEGNYAAGKNKIINGDFGIWQRGTTFTGIASSTYACDRWQVGSTVATLDVSRSTFTPGAAPVAGYESDFFATITADAGDADGRFQQQIENVTTFAGQTVTVSFYAKSTITTDALRWIRLQQNFGGGGSAIVNTDSAAITLSGSWARYSVTISVPSISGKTIGTNSSLILMFGLKASTAQTLDLWGVQVEAGSVATAFQTATGTIQGELAACQRYYQRITTASGAGYLSTLGSGGSTTVAKVTFAQKQTFRRVPLSVDYSNVALSDGINIRHVVTLVTIHSLSGSDVTLLDLTSSGLTQARPYWALAQSGVVGFIGLSAEL
jgi:hypothetical protein